MVVKSTVTTSTIVEDDYIAHLSDFESVNHQVTLAAVDEIEDPLLNELAFMPGTPASPFVWSHNKEENDRARRWWFWAISAGKVRTDGSHYIRTGDLVNSWSIEIQADGLETRVVLSNPANILPLVQGSLAQDLTAAARFQIPGHKKTGWPLVAETANFWLNDIFPEVYDEKLQETVLTFAETTRKRRAFTPQRRT